MSLAKHLEIFQESLVQFVTLLEEEQWALASSAVDGKVIADIASRKGEMLVNINKLDDVRQKVQKKIGYPDGREGARLAAKDGGCSDLWDAILILSDRAKNLNELNGIQVNMRLEQNRKLVDFFNKASGGPLYGRDGKSKMKRLGGISTRA